MQRVALNKEREDTSITPNDATTNHCREDDRRNPWYETVCREPECEQANPGQLDPNNSRRKTVLWLRAAGDPCCLFAVTDEAAVVCAPDGIREDGCKHADEETDEAETDFGEGEAVVVFEDDGKGAEEEVEDAEEDGAEETEEQDHWLEEEELKGAQAAPGDGADQ